MSLGSLGFALVVDGFIWSRWVTALEVVGLTRVRPDGHWVHTGSPWESLRSSGVVGFTRDHPVGSWVHPVSLGSLGFALQVVWLIRGRWVHSRSPWVSLGSSRAVNQGSLGSLSFTLGFVGFLRGHWIHSGSCWGS